MPKPILGAERRTNPLIWLAAIICAVLTVAVIITGAAIFAVYMIYQPKTPDVRVAYAHLLSIGYDKWGTLAVQLAITLVAENHNSKMHASFNDFVFSLFFRDVRIAELRALPFEVEKNSSLPLNYPVETAAVMLDAAGRDEVDRALKGTAAIGFNLKGQARTRWRVGVFASVKIYTHLDCNLQFFAPNGTRIGLRCVSKTG